MEASRRVLVSIAVLGITSAADSNVAVALGDAVAVIAVSVETPTRRPKHLQRVSSLTRSMGTDLGLVGRGVGPQFGMPRISVARPAICRGGDNDGGQNAWLTYRVSRSGGPVNEYYLASR
jgi:hypothetical protein